MRIRNGAVTRLSAPRVLPAKVATSLRPTARTRPKAPSPTSSKYHPKVDNRLSASTIPQRLLSRLSSGAWTALRRFWKWVWRWAWGTAARSGVLGSDVAQLSKHDLGLLHRLNRPFAGTVTINPRETALQIASSEHLRTEANRLVLWTDASVRSSFYNDSPYAAGISIVWRPSHTPHDWKNQTYGLRGHFTTGEAEFFAIAEAMRLAVEMVRDRTKRSGHNQPDQVVIYTDSQTSLVWISRYHHFSLSARYRVARQRELAILKQRARALTKMGVNLELRYVPGHANVEGNVMADFFAKRASGSAAGYVVSEQYEQLEPAVDGYLGSRPPLASLARSQRVLHQRRLGKREAAPILNMRFRSSTRATNVGSSLSPTNRATSARMILSQRPLRPGKNMKKYRALMQSQLKKTVLPKTQPVPQRIPSLKIQDLRRTITIDGVTKQIMKRPPPPPPSASALPRPSSHAVEEARG